jgi:small conductance mechanosensitive channel
MELLRDVFAFNLTPLLTSAGIAGVAIGLAAQTIVKDVLNGSLFLIEDQYNVGDVIIAASVTGVVETMTLRKTSIRGFDGTLYVVPNSQIVTVANQSRDFSSTTLNISVDFSANPDKVIGLLKKIVLEVRNDPAYKDIFRFHQGVGSHLPDRREDTREKAIRRTARDAEADPHGAGGEQHAAR